MLNEPLEKYKKLYSESLQAFLDLHNYHYEFLEFKRLRNKPGKKLRNQLRKLKTLYSDMVKLCSEAEKLQREISPPPLGAPVRNHDAWLKKHSRVGPAKRGRPRKEITKRPRVEEQSKIRGRPRKQVTNTPSSTEQQNTTKENTNE
jgi:hypothetical protein